MYPVSRFTVFLLSLLPCFSFGQALSSWNFDQQRQAWFAAESQRLADSTASELAAIEDWAAYREQARTELLDMLGLHPLPERTPLRAVVTGTTEHAEFRVEKVHFQASPGLYVTGNLYVPKNVTGQLPAVLYVCGHANVKENGISYGAKVNYHHHAAWFARNGYVCLIIDTLQLAEIEGIHHGLYRYDRWWWLSRGYTPAGVEAWFAIRAVDYLVSRPEVDPARIGMTGRSGGGINSWWGAALDERIRVAVPVAGITDLTNHVVDGCVEGHCDCMYFVNTYRWDYAKLAALAAPRPLLISNSDQDPIFPIDGVFRTYMRVRDVYRQLDAEPQIALNTVSGPHKDVQELRVAAFRWFNRYLRDTEELIDQPAVKYFEPEELRVFDELPADERNTRIDEFFVPTAPPVAEVLAQEGWANAAESWREAIDRYAFARRWETPAGLEQRGAYTSSYGRLELWELAPDQHTHLPLFRLSAPAPAGRRVKVIVLDDAAWRQWAPRLRAAFPAAAFWPESPGDAPSPEAALAGLYEQYDEIYLLPTRGAGPAVFAGDERTQTHIRRRYFLLGRTLEELQTFDLVQAMNTVNLDGKTVTMEARGPAAGMLVYASLFGPPPLSLELYELPLSHDEGPHYLSIRRYLDLPAALLLAANSNDVTVYGGGEEEKALQEVGRRHGVELRVVAE